MAELDLWSMLFVFMLATFVGFQVIRNVSRLLHTPLMSLTNAISAIAVVGAILVAGEEESTATTDPGRGRRRRVDDQHRQRLPHHRPHAQDVPRAGAQAVIHGLTQLTYLVAAALFILSLRWMSDPETARRGVAAGVGGMALAIVGTLLAPEIVNFTLDRHRRRSSARSSACRCRWVPLTAVPQRTALSHAFGGLAAGLVGTAKYCIWFQHGELTHLPHGGDRARGASSAS